MNGSFRFAVVILAAGASSRMGRPKLLLSWSNTTVLDHLVQQWGSLGAAQTAVVHSAVAADIIAEMDRIGLQNLARIPNHRPQNGMFSSIQCAARWSGWHAGLTHWTLVLGDQPQISRSACEALLKAASIHPDKACQLSLNGKAKHPVILPRGIFEKLSTTAVPDLRTFLALAPEIREFCESPDDSPNYDIDFEHDYLAVRHRFDQPVK